MKERDARRLPCSGREGSPPPTPLRDGFQRHSSHGLPSRFTCPSLVSSSSSRAGAAMSGSGSLQEKVLEHSFHTLRSARCRNSFSNAPASREPLRRAALRLLSASCPISSTIHPPVHLRPATICTHHGADFCSCSAALPEPARPPSPTASSTSAAAPEAPCAARYHSPTRPPRPTKRQRGCSFVNPSSSRPCCPGRKLLGA